MRKYTRSVFLLTVLICLGNFVVCQVVFTGTKPVTDLKETTKTAEAGNAEAQFMLGCAYFRGRPIKKMGGDPREVFVDRDMELALKWIRSAADQGYAPAQVSLSSLLMD